MTVVSIINKNALFFIYVYGLAYSYYFDYNNMINMEGATSMAESTPEDSTLPYNCWDCSNIDCRLPFSKVLPNRKLSEYVYKRHPKCEMKVNSESK